MRKLVLEEWITIDGYAADENGEMDFFVNKENTSASDKDILEAMTYYDTIILGANTYKIFAEYWPGKTKEEEIIADVLNSTQKIVFSSTLKNAPWGKWKEAKIISGDAVESMKELKQQEGKDMIMWGSLSLAKTFIDAGLVDEFHFRVCPSSLGKGLPVFAPGQKQELKLISSKLYEVGVMLLSYKPA